MENLNNLTFINMIKGWNDNQDVIRDYIQNREGYQQDGANNSGDSAAILGLSVGFFLILLMVSVLLFFISIYLLAVNWDLIPTWAKVVGIIALFFAPLITVIVVLVTKGQGQGVRQQGVGYGMYAVHNRYSLKSPLKYSMHNSMHNNGGYGMHNNNGGYGMHNTHTKYHIRRLGRDL